MISEAKWKAMRGEAAGKRLARTAQLAIAAAAFLILSVLPVQAQTETVLHSFAGGPSEGGTPSGSLVEDGSGNLYGTTQMGGASNAPGPCSSWSPLRTSKRRSCTALGRPVAMVKCP